jgi:hypothetical protein
MGDINGRLAAAIGFDNAALRIRHWEALTTYSYFPRVERSARTTAVDDVMAQSVRPSGRSAAIEAAEEQAAHRTLRAIRNTRGR